MNIVKLLATLAALLLLPTMVLFAYMGMLAAVAGNMVALAKCFTLLGILLVAEILCVSELIRNDL